MNTKELIDQLNNAADTVSFSQTIETIESDYNYSPARFTNGKGDNAAINEAGTNEGSCKIFAFAQLNKLSPELTLQCFGDYYRVDVLQNPHGNDHSNIRNFITHGWDGIQFESDVLSKK